MKKLYLFLILFCAYSTVSAQQQVTCGVFTFDVLITPVLCNGNCDGAIQISNISGGTPGYTTFWSTGSTVPSIFNLCADDYTIFISDNVGDTCSMTFTVPQPDSIQVSETLIDASCAGCCDGDIILSPTGGSPPYNYTFWDSTGVSIFPPNLCPSTYSWCVTDANGCITCDTVTISYPTVIKNNNNIATDFFIYPNPNKGNFIIEIENVDDVTMQIYTISGTLVLEQRVLKNNKPIHLKEYPKGIYFIKIETQKGQIIKKLIYQ